MRRILCQFATLAALSIGLTRSAYAQFEGLLSGITDVSLNASCAQARGEFTSNDCLSKSTFGIEMIWRVREIARNGMAAIPTVQRHTGTTRTTRRAAGDTVAYTETTETYAVVPGPDTASKYWILELALGYSQFASVRSRDASFELRGTARELPALTVYLSFDGYLGAVTPYVGVRSGIIDIQNLQAIDGVRGIETTVYSATPRAFQLGGIIGLAFGTWMLQPRIEYAYHLRDFPSLQWSPGKVPTRVPREIAFSGSTITVGLQINVRDLKP